MQGVRLLRRCHLRKSTVLLVTLARFLVSSEYANYNGHKVIRVIPQSDNHIQELRMLNEFGPTGVELWSSPTVVGRHVDVQVHPDYYSATVQSFRKRGLPMHVTHDDLQRSVERHLQTNKRLTGAGNFYRRYHNLSEIMTWLDNTAKQCGPRCSTVAIGTSYEGRNLTVFRIISHGKPKIWVDSMIHAREWISAPVTLYTIERLLNYVKTDSKMKKLVDSFDWYFQPVVNPDGYDYTWTTDRLWRKTRSRSPEPGCFGADANRNYGFKWSTIGVSIDPCRNIYPGWKPFSEAETRAQAKYILSQNGTWALFLTLHSFGQQILAPWGYTTRKPPDYNRLISLGKEAAAALKGVYGTEYQVDSASRILYRSSGTSRDWARGVAKIKYSYTMELRDSGLHAFMLPPNQIRDTVRETWAGFKVIFQRLQREFDSMTF